MEDDLNNLINLWSSSSTSIERQQIIDHILEHRKYKYVIKSLLDHKNSIFENCQEIHQEIIKLQQASKEKQNQARNINNFLTQLYNIDHSKILDEENKENDEFITNKENAEEFKNSKTKNKENKEKENKENENKENENKENKDEGKKKQKDKKIKEQIKRKMNRKAKLIKSMKRNLEPKTEMQNLQERERVVREIQRYGNINYEKLNVQKVLCDSAHYLDSIKLMEHDVIRIRFKPNQKSSYHQLISILKYLEKCDLTPRILHFNTNKQTVYLPYYGDPALKTSQNHRTLGLMLRKLKRNWGVYLLKNGQILNSLKPHAAMYSHKLNRFFIYDFTSPDWVVDRDRSYPMIN